MDGEALLALTPADLRDELRIDSLAHRKQLLRSLSAFPQRRSGQVGDGMGDGEQLAMLVSGAVQLHSQEILATRGVHVT